MSAEIENLKQRIDILEQEKNKMEKEQKKQAEMIRDILEWFRNEMKVELDPSSEFRFR